MAAATTLDIRYVFSSFFRNSLSNFILITLSTLRKIRAAIPVVKKPRKAFFDQNIDAIIQAGKSNMITDFFQPYLANIFGNRMRLMMPNINNQISGRDNSKNIELFSPNRITG